MATSLLFTGHMTDAAGRDPPRFPESHATAVAAKIGAAIDGYRGQPRLLAFASLARGGDILFQEACLARGIETRIVLPFPPETFVETSVRSPGTDWETRFWSIWKTSARRREVLGLPVTDGSYRLCNQHLLARARRHGQLVLIALHDGKTGGPAGGTGDFLGEAATLATRSIILSPSIPPA